MRPRWVSVQHRRRLDDNSDGGGAAVVDASGPAVGGQAAAAEAAREPYELAALAALPRIAAEQAQADANAAFSPPELFKSSHDVKETARTQHVRHGESEEQLFPPSNRCFAPAGPFPQCDYR